MSHLSVLGLTPGEPAVELTDLGNAHRGAPLLWRWLGRTYVAPDFDLGPPPAGGDVLEAVWALLDDARVPLAHRRVLAMTAKLSVVRRDDYRSAAADLLGMPPEAGPHWPAIGAFLADGAADDHPMVALLSSVDECPFPELVEGDDGEEVLRGFDWTTVRDVHATVR